MTRSQLLPIRVSSLALAIGLAAGPSPAAAQSFQGTGTPVGFSASVDQGTVGQTIVTVNQSQAVIDWSPTPDGGASGTAFNFQPSGTTATFQNNPGLLGGFAVLNRINVTDNTRMIGLNGTINSLVNGQTGGNVFFYSPSGFVIGSSAVINVGSLVLSASPIAVNIDGQGNPSFINNGTVLFDQAPNPNAAINTVSDINGTAQINANGSGSYVALVAPQIRHQGDIRTDGAAALVAAEAATINFSPDGLFNIQVTVGTDAGTGIHVDGGTIGRGGAAEGVNDHRAYLVAVAKNDAVTMLINNGAAVGFETATSAEVENNVVVLSGGYDISGGDHWITSGVSEVPLTITNASLSSSVDAQVTGGAGVNSSQGNLTFGGNLSIIGGETTTTGGNVLVDGQNGNTLTIAGNLDARAFRRNADGSQTGLITRLGADQGSTVTIGGDVTLDSDSFGAEAADNGLNGTSATGGNAQVNIGANSTLDVTGSVTVHADGYGGGNAYSGGAGGNGIGGQAFLMSIFGGATVNVGGSVYVSAQGFGGGVNSDCQAECGVTGGMGRGGSATVHTNVGAPNQMHLASDVTVSAAGIGGDGDVQAGAGVGGTANIGAADGSTLTVGGDTNVDAIGLGGYGFDNVGGTGIGGTARVTTGGTGGSQLELTGPVFISADGEGGAAANGGRGTGGQAYMVAVLGNIHAFNDVTVTANSFGGEAFSGTGSGGAGLADTETVTTSTITEANLFAGAGTLTIDGLALVAAHAFGGDGGFAGGNGGNAVAGSATVHAGNRDDGMSVIQLGTVVATADAQGGAGGDGQGGTNGSDGGDGGSATGGRAIITAAAGSGDITAGATLLSASATGGTGGSGGIGDGGNGGNGGDGGIATAGFINAGSESGNVNFAQGTNNGTANYTTIVALSTATGGDGGDGGPGNIGGTGGNGGDAFGGNSVLLVRGSVVTVGGVTLDASASGGNGGLSPTAPDGDGGDASAGVVGVVVTNRFNLPLQRATLNAGDIVGTAVATGGTGGQGNGLSLSTGGNQFVVRNSDATVSSVSLVTTADALDGNSPLVSSSPIEIQNGTANINGQFVFQTPGEVSMWNDSGTLNAAQIIVDADNFIHDEFLPAPVALGTFSANNIFLTTSQDLIVDGHLSSLNGVGFTAPGLIDFDNVSSTNGPLALTAGSTVDAGNLSSGDLVGVNGGGNVTIGTVAAFGGRAAIISNGGSVSTGNIGAADFIALNALTTITAGNLNAGNFVNGQSGGSILTGNINAGGSIMLLTGGGIATGNLTGTDINLDAFGDVSFGNVLADNFEFETDGDVTGGDITASEHVGGETLGAVLLGDISVGPGLPPNDDSSVGIAGGASVTVGDVTGSSRVGFATFGDLDTGNIVAGDLFLALVGGDANIGSITAAGGTVYMADASMYDIGTGGGEFDFDYTLVVGLDPVPTGGSITIGGPVSTGLFQAAAGGGLSTQAIAAQTIEASAGGTATINGIWSAQDVTLASNDINIGGAGGISGSASGLVTLVSTNAAQALIGDGLTGSGYALSNAEFGRIEGGSVYILARGDASAAQDMLVGDLTVTGPAAGSTIENSAGILVFATGDVATQTPGGVIRVVGDVAATGFGPANAMEFHAGRFELDAATGSISITSSGTTLGGELGLYASRIHVASGQILDRLALDPQYAGYQDDLNAPAAVQRPEGVLNAGVIWIESGNLQSILIQNTGTAVVPAGFLANEVLVNDDDEVAGPPGSIDVVVNGQLIANGARLTGVAVRDARVAGENLSPFTIGSMINSCLLTGACGLIEPPEPLFPPGFTPTPGIQEMIRLTEDELLPPPIFDNESLIDDNDPATEEGETSPIEPPQPLFDTSGLGDKGDVDDPVSGSGNPALMETSPPTSNQEKQP